MYPWEGAWLEDGETCPCLGDMDLETGERRPNQMGEKEVHINADIAYAVWQYYTVTGDEAFMRDYGNEIILSTAAFWLSRAEKRNGRYEILDVIGPDEYKENIDNNAYTNYMAHFNLWLAREILKKLSQEERDTLNRRLALEKLEEGLPEVLELLYLPVPDVDGILPQFDGFRNLKDFRCEKYKTLEKVGMIFRDYPFEEIKNMQICKQADNIMLFYTLSGQFD